MRKLLMTSLLVSVLALSAGLGLASTAVIEVGGLHTLPPALPTQVYKGDTTVFPQLTATHTLDEDPTDGVLVYLYGADKLTDDSGTIFDNTLQQIHQQTYPAPAAQHTWTAAGNATYKNLIMFATLNFDHTTGQWQTVDSGIDVQQNSTYEVRDIPSPDPSFLAALLSTLMGLLPPGW